MCNFPQLQFSTGMRESITALLFRVLAVTDFLTLQETLTIWIQNFFGQESTALHTWGCRVGFFLMKSFKTISAWLLVGVALERFIGKKKNFIILV